MLKRMPALSPSDQEGERGGGSHIDGDLERGQGDPERGQGGRLNTRGRAKEQIKGVQRQKQVGPIQALNLSFTRCGKITDPSDSTLFICKMRP